MNQQKYDDLCKRVGSASLDPWYLKTEEIFKAQKIRSEKDFMKVVAYAYSWMPTIPSWGQDLDWEACKAAMRRFKMGADGSLKEILELIVPSINNSVVGASKVLHFVCPHRAPIIDSNVVVGWRTLFFPTGIRHKSKSGATALPSDFGAYGKNVQKRKRHIDLYVAYAENLAEWAKHLRHASARDVEVKLYLLGKQVSEGTKRAKREKSS